MSFKEKIKGFLKEKFNLAFLVILIVAIILRLKYLFKYSVWPDEALYAWYGYKLLHSPMYLFSAEFTHTISYIPSLVIAFFNIFTNPFIAGKLMAFVFAILGIILIYLLGKEIKNEFLGLIAAIFLTFATGHWFNSTKVLLDIPLTTMFTLVIYTLIKYEKTHSQKWFYFFILSIALTIYTKVTAILIIPMIILYFLIDHKLKVFSLFKKREFKIGLILLIILVAPLFIINLINFGGLTVESPARYVSTEEAGSKLQPTNDIIFNVTWYILPLSIIGIILSLFYRKKEHYLLLIPSIVIYVWFTFFHPQTVDRYLLIIVPFMFLFAALAIVEIKEYLKNFKININSWIFVIIALALMIPMIINGYNLLEFKIHTYTGFEEAGSWLKDNVEKDAVIYSYSTRALRVFSEIEFDVNNGQLKGPPSDKIEFEKEISSINNPIYLVVDLWEYIQPDWMYPLNQEKFNYFISQNFQPVKIVERDLPTQNGLIKQPVIVIFKKS